MFKIRKIYDDGVPGNRRAIESVQKHLRDQFPDLAQSDIDKLPDQLKDPVKYQFRSVLFIAENGRKEVVGFALLLFAPDLNFSYLDFISAAKYQTGRGIGGALYERVREEALMFKSKGLFFECLPDEPALCRDPVVLRQNKSRLRFYEKYGARPLIHTKYEMPLKEDGDNPPLLVIDTLGKPTKFSRMEMRAIVQAILIRKYSDVCNTEYISMVVNSIVDNPVQLRDFKYVTTETVIAPKKVIPLDKRIVLLINDKHDIHHVRDRGYVEAPVRISTILKAIRKTNFFTETPVRHFPDKHIFAVHDRAFVSYLYKVCRKVPAGHSVYPYVFPIRNTTRPPKELAIRAGYFCIDTFTPLNQNAYLAARRASDCALTAATSILEGAYLAYALVRPPGHHAERNVFGGFCYFNSTAIAAHYLSAHGKVAILDIDYHHGNGQQNIFYKRKDVLTLSIHGHPRYSYPYFSGFSEECGEGDGKGFNMNYPLKEHITFEKYLETLRKAFSRIEKFKPQFLVVALGFDTAKGDPTGSWNHGAAEFEKIGSLIGELPYSTLLVQEGGYKTRTLGTNARRFFTGLWKGSFM